MTDGCGDDEVDRREWLALLGISTGAVGATTIGFTKYFLDNRRKPGDDPGNRRYNQGEDYTGSDIDSWDEALPGDCELDDGQKDWLENKLSEYDLESDDPLEYAGGKVRYTEPHDGELRIEIDEDWDGGEFERDYGHNIPNSC